MKKLSVILGATAMALVLSACEGPQIFEDEGAKYRPDPKSNTELANDVYYVKEGTKFYEVYDADTSGGGGDVDNTRCAYNLDLYAKKVPTYYKGELIAYASKKNTIDDVKLERYSDTGYSIGIHGAEWNEDGYITFSLNQDTVKKSDADVKFKNNRSNDIMIEAVNGQSVSGDMINKAGVFVGFEEGKDYEITFWAGTYYGKTIVKADTHFYQSFEAYTLTDHEITKNGYIAVRVPEDLKSGYYMVDGEGLFRYIEGEKGTDLASVNYNEPYFASAEDQLAAYSQQYNFSISSERRSGSIVAKFDTSSIAELSNPDSVKMMVTSPDGNRELFEPDLEKGTLTASYTTLQPGKWIVNITPQSLLVTGVDVVDNSAEMEKTENTYTFNIEKEGTGIEFYVDYEGEGEVNAQVIGPDGQSHDLTEGREFLGDLGYVYSWLAPGEYTIHVYHYPDTKIIEASYGINEKNKEEEIITVED